MFVRLYTGSDGRSHFEELDMASGLAAFDRMQTATGVMFRHLAPGDFQDWHSAPRRQYVITLQGSVEIGIGDGTSRTFGSGDVMLAEDLGGQGHTTRVIGDSPRVFAVVPLE
jgi:quercetin dioxygenase-like cupin family protein